MALLTVCVCIRNGERDVRECLEGLLREARAAAGQIDILVVDHLSADRTVVLAREVLAENGVMSGVLSFTKEGIGAVRDFAWRQCHSPWVGFVDVDCVVEPGWGKDALQRIEMFAPRLSLAGFGGASLVARRLDPIYRAFPLALESWVGGHGALLNRPVARAQPVDHCPTLNVIYRRAALEAVGGFNTGFTRVAEDLDLSARLVRAGYELWGVPGMAVRHALRSTMGGWARNMFLYGRGRRLFETRHPTLRQTKFLAPQALVVFYGCGVALSMAGLWPPLVGLVGGHFSALFLILWKKNTGVSTILRATSLVWLTHIQYGLGFWYERIFRGLSRSFGVRGTSFQKTLHSDTQSTRSRDAA